MKPIPILGVGSAQPIPGKELLAQDPSKNKLVRFAKWTGKKGLQGSIEASRWLAYGAIAAAGLVFTLPGNKVGNEIAQDVLRIIPQPHERPPIPTIDGYEYDGFFANQYGFSDIDSTVRDLTIDPKDIDLNSDRIVLDSREEIRKLFETLKEYDPEGLNEGITTALVALKIIDIHDQVIFGTEGIDPETFYQGGIPNCQILATLKGLSYTPENRQTLRSAVKVTGYSYKEGESYINISINIDGEELEMQYTKLVKWMSPLYYSPSQATDGSLALPLLAAATEEAGEKYDTVPHYFPSTSPILLTGKDFYAISTWSMSDKDLREILSLPPENIVTVSSYAEEFFFNKGISKSITDFYDYLAENIEDKLKDKEAPVLSEQKAVEFQASVDTRIEQIMSSLNIPITIPIEQNNNLTGSTDSTKAELIASSSPLKELLPASRSQAENIPPQQTYTRPIITNHQYAVKSYTRVGDQDIIILTDSHGIEYEPITSLDEFREKIGSLVVAKEQTPWLNARSALILALLATLGGTTRALTNKGRKLVNPQYKNWADKTADLLINKWFDDK